MLYVAEIAGADSIAAALAFAESHPGARLLPTYVSTGTEFGDFAQIEANVEFLRGELPLRGAVLEGDLIHVSDPALWRALNGAPARALTERFGVHLPCVGCHLYLHLMRVPIARECGSTTIISGERELHGGRTKANQTAEALDAYAKVLAEAGIELAQPIRTVVEPEEVARILGPHWEGGSPQLECVLSGNETGLDGSCVGALPRGFASDFLVPAGRAVVGQLLAGSSDWSSTVGQIVRSGGASA